MALTDLLFSQAPATGQPVNLVFGAGETTVPATINATLEGLLPQPVLTGVISVVPITQATLSGELPQPALVGLLDVRQTYIAALAGVLPPVQLIADLPMEYISNTARPTVGQVHDDWQVAGHGESGIQDLRQPTLKTPVGCEGAYQRADKTALSTGFAFSESERMRIAQSAKHQTGQRSNTDARSVYSDAQRAMRRMLANAFQEAAKAQTPLNLQRHQDGLRDRWAALDTRWQVAARNRIIGTTGTASPALWLNKGWNQDHENAMRPPAGMYVRPTTPASGEPCYVPDANLLFWQTPGRDLVFICERAVIAPPVIPGQVVVPVRRVYMVINNASLRRVDGNIALHSTSMTLGLDVDSWTWSFSAALPGRVLSDLEPASSGAPVELEAMINGTVFRVLVESISRERTFGKNDIRVQGRGKTALLDGPYAPVRSFGNTIDRTAQQLMGDVLTVNNVPMGWAVNWGLTDWLVPAGVFAHQGSYISALNTIAAAAGGYIQPHASLQSLDVRARYPVAPWAWGAVLPDFELPADVTTREGIEWVEKARYNRVFVSGQQSGVLGQVTRAGTAGDLLAPMVTDALITTAAAARQRGISVLGNTGRQANISLRLPVLAETGVITPGKFVRYVDAGTTRTGLVRSVSVTTNFPQVWQSIGVETHV